MNHSSDRPAVSASADLLPGIGDLRMLEDFLDWMENHKSVAPPRWKLIIFPLLPVLALAATLWRCIAQG